VIEAVLVPAIGLQYVAVEHDGVLAKRLVVDDRAQLRPMSRLISWVRPPILPRTDSRSFRVLVARGKHRVLAGHPAEPGALTPPRNPSVTLAATNTGSGQTAPTPSPRPGKPSPGEPNLSKLIMATSVGSRGHELSLEEVISHEAPGVASETGPSK
jgi:hypothetical protein